MDNVRFTLSYDKDKADLLKNTAKMEKRSVSNYISTIIFEYLNTKFKKKKKGKK